MIIITGMQRSGTSFAAHLTHEVGQNSVDQDTLVPADRWNPKGYYENLELLVLHDRIVLGSQSIGRKFRTIPESERGVFLKLAMSLLRSRYLLLEGKRAISERSARAEADIRKIAGENAVKPLKDPRFALTIGEWRKYAPINRILLCYRDPREVARSLKQRYALPSWLSYRLWQRSIDTFLEQAEGLPVVFIHYNNFTRGDGLQEIRRIYNFLGKPFVEPEARQALDRVFDRRLWHNRALPDTFPPNIQQKYERLHAYHAVYSEPKPLVAVGQLSQRHGMTAQTGEQPQDV